MRRSLRLAVTATSLVTALGACNALTGASSLETCELCGDLAAPDAAAVGEGAAPPPQEGGLPATCTGSEAACSGKVAAQCVNSAWVKTTCEDQCVAGKCAPWPSCANAAGTACGATASPTSCCATASVPGGTFNRRSTMSSSNGNNLATVSAFELDKYEVTVGRMRAFVTAGGATQIAPPVAGVGAHPKIANSGWLSVWNALLPADLNALRAMLATANPTWTDVPMMNEHLPINNVSWFVAFAFCAWDGARLPTYAEWNFAAAGGSDQRTYPWSTSATDTAITESRAAYECRYSPPARSCPATKCSDDSSSPCNPLTCLAPLTCVTPACTGCAFADIARVGTLPMGAGKWGHLDSSGNVAELVLDVSDPLSSPCVDCARLAPTALKGGGGNGPRLDANFIVAGGGWAALPTGARSLAFSSQRDAAVDDSVGFRCAR